MVRITRGFAFFILAKGNKKLFQKSKAFQICFGEFIKKVTKRCVAVLVDQTAIDVFGNTPKRFTRAGINGGSKARVSPNASAQ